jgi:uridine kinase
VALLLAPLGPGGDRLYRTTSFDLESDRPVEQKPEIAAEDAILIVDGTFLQRTELSNQWDATVFVRTSVETSEARGLGRDMERLGGEEAAKDLYARRYRPAYTLYERLSEPERRCDAIVDNDDLTRPQLHMSAQSRLD